MRKMVFVVFAAVLLMGQMAFAAEFKVGFVDLVKALNESDAGKKAKTDLEFMIKSKQGVLDEKGKAIEKLRSELEKQASVLSQDARKGKEEELERLIRDYQRLVADSQNEVKKKEGEVTGEIVKELRAIVAKFGEEEGYTVILDNAEGLILFSKKDADLTESIIKRYNESKGKGKK